MNFAREYFNWYVYVTMGEPDGFDAVYSLTEATIEPTNAV